MSAHKCRIQIEPTGKEISFNSNEFIVSKTDTRGIMTYANSTFLKTAGYTEKEIIGKPHNLIRHPEMPKCAFKLVWNTIKTGNEIFAYVVNLTKNGDHYWALAHISPSFNQNGEITGYHSNRRKPEQSAIAQIQPIYKTLLTEEGKHQNPQSAMEASTKILLDLLASNNISYDEFILSL